MVEEYLTAAEVAAFLKMEARTFRDFRRRNPEFPGPIAIGLTRGKQPILRWKRSEVDAYLKVQEYRQRQPVEVEEDPDE